MTKDAMKKVSRQVMDRFGKNLQVSIYTTQRTLKSQQEKDIRI